MLCFIFLLCRTIEICSDPHVALSIDKLSFLKSEFSDISQYTDCGSFVTHVASQFEDILSRHIGYLQQFFNHYPHKFSVPELHADIVSSTSRVPWISDDHCDVAPDDGRHGSLVSPLLPQHSDEAQQHIRTLGSTSNEPKSPSRLNIISNADVAAPDSFVITPLAQKRESTEVFDAYCAASNFSSDIEDLLTSDSEFAPREEESAAGDVTCRSTEAMDPSSRTDHRQEYGNSFARRANLFAPEVVQFTRSPHSRDKMSNNTLSENVDKGYLNMDPSSEAINYCISMVDTALQSKPGISNNSNNNNTFNLAQQQLSSNHLSTHAPQSLPSITISNVSKIPTLAMAASSITSAASAKFTMADIAATSSPRPTPHRELILSTTASPKSSRQVRDETCLGGIISRLAIDLTTEDENEDNPVVVSLIPPSTFHFPNTQGAKLRTTGEEYSEVFDASSIFQEQVNHTTEDSHLFKTLSAGEMSNVHHKNSSTMPTLLNRNSWNLFNNSESIGCTSSNNKIIPPPQNDRRRLPGAQKVDLSEPMRSPNVCNQNINIMGSNIQSSNNNNNNNILLPYNEVEEIRGDVFSQAEAQEQQQQQQEEQQQQQQQQQSNINYKGSSSLTASVILEKLLLDPSSSEVTLQLIQKVLSTGNCVLSEEASQQVKKLQKDTNDRSECCRLIDYDDQHTFVLTDIDDFHQQNFSITDDIPDSNGLDYNYDGGDSTLTKQKSQILSFPASAVVFSLETPNRAPVLEGRSNSEKVNQTFSTTHEIKNGFFVGKDASISPLNRKQSVSPSCLLTRPPPLFSTEEISFYSNNFDNNNNINNTSAFDFSAIPNQNSPQWEHIESKEDSLIGSRQNANANIGRHFENFFDAAAAGGDRNGRELLTLNEQQVLMSLQDEISLLTVSSSNIDDFLQMEHPTTSITSFSSPVRPAVESLNVDGIQGVSTSPDKKSIRNEASLNKDPHISLPMFTEEQKLSVLSKGRQHNIHQTLQNVSSWCLSPQRQRKVDNELTPFSSVPNSEAVNYSKNLFKNDSTSNPSGNQSLVKLTSVITSTGSIPIPQLISDGPLPILPQLIDYTSKKDTQITSFLSSSSNNNSSIQTSIAAPAASYVSSSSSVSERKGSGSTFLQGLPSFANSALNDHVNTLNSLNSARSPFVYMGTQNIIKNTHREIIKSDSIQSILPMVKNGSSIAFTNEQSVSSFYQGITPSTIPSSRSIILNSIPSNPITTSSNKGSIKLSDPQPQPRPSSNSKENNNSLFSSDNSRTPFAPISNYQPRDNFHATQGRKMHSSLVMPENSHASSGNVTSVRELVNKVNSLVRRHDSTASLLGNDLIPTPQTLFNQQRHKHYVNNQNANSSFQSASPVIPQQQDLIFHSTNLNSPNVISQNIRHKVEEKEIQLLTNKRNEQRLNVTYSLSQPPSQSSQHLTNQQLFAKDEQERNIEEMRDDDEQSVRPLSTSSRFSSSSSSSSSSFLGRKVSDDDGESENDSENREAHTYQKHLKHTVVNKKQTYQQQMTMHSSIGVEHDEDINFNLIYLN